MREQCDRFGLRLAAFATIGMILVAGIVMRTQKWWGRRAWLAAVAAVGVGVVFAAPASATVSGRNGLIAFRADTGSGYQIYTMRSDGSGKDQLTNVAGDALQPHWSPNSRLITFEFDPANPTANVFCQVAYMHADGSDMKLLPEGNGDMCEGSPSFGPQGGRIFYEGFDGQRDALFSMNLRGRDRRFVTSCGGRGATDPEVAPNGEMLAFTCFSSNGQALFDARINGSHLRRLTSFALDVGTKADWSPDSRRIMFICARNEGSADAQVNTATIRPNGTGLFWVTHSPAGGKLEYGNSYSPDGRWILLRIEENNQYALFKIHPFGHGLRQITAFSDFRPRGMAWGSHR
jgi:Tol biopolymer transport system component